LLSHRAAMIAAQAAAKPLSRPVLAETGGL